MRIKRTYTLRESTVDYLKESAKAEDCGMNQIIDLLAIHGKKAKLFKEPAPPPQSPD